MARYPKPERPLARYWQQRPGLVRDLRAFAGGGYFPHQGPRERERRVRQQQRDCYAQIDRATRRGAREFVDGVEIAVGVTRTGRKRYYTAG